MLKNQQLMLNKRTVNKAAVNKNNICMLMKRNLIKLSVEVLNSLINKTIKRLSLKDCKNTLISLITSSLKHLDRISKWLKNMSILQEPNPL